MTHIPPLTTTYQSPKPLIYHIVFFQRFQILFSLHIISISSVKDKRLFQRANIVLHRGRCRLPPTRSKAVRYLFWRYNVTGIINQKTYDTLQQCDVLYFLTFHNILQQNRMINALQIIPSNIRFFDVCCIRETAIFEISVPRIPPVAAGQFIVLRKRERQHLNLHVSSRQKRGQFSG